MVITQDRLEIIGIVDTSLMFNVLRREVALKSDQFSED